MHYELRSNRVRMYMPEEDDQGKWFNMMLIHQNRYVETIARILHANLIHLYRVKHGPQNSVPEGMFDDSLDLVVWGHEHDCRIEPEAVPRKNYFITQPGSSVATSLSQGESIQKYVTGPMPDAVNLPDLLRSCFAEKLAFCLFKVTSSTSNPSYSRRSDLSRSGKS